MRTESTTDQRDSSSEGDVSQYGDKIPNDDSFCSLIEESDQKEEICSYYKKYYASNKSFTLPYIQRTLDLIEFD